ncbi:hypothetical protein ANANG_G00026750 [Anguilla anguilla]|uniref:Uncharacterized protein n=1 Tax=Anguilla anguilla TaxID=7936 RepID=A0A9D3S855_ANGAN|nr:hypothetical protein ANANG_G00026750 [Anguilla anguilla]
MEQRQCSWPVTVLVFAAVLWMQRGSNFGPRPSHSSHRPNLWLALCGLSRGGIRACPCAGRSAAQAPVLSGPDRAYLDKRAVLARGPGPSPAAGLPAAERPGGPARGRADPGGTPPR